MRNTNYLRLDERIVFFSLGTISYLILQRIHAMYGFKTTLVALICAIIIIQIIEWTFKIIHKIKKRD